MTKRKRARLVDTVSIPQRKGERQRSYARSPKGRTTATAKMRRYRQSPDFKQKQAGRSHRYRQSTKYKENVLRHRESGQQKKWTRRYNQSTKRKQVRHQYNQSAKGWEASQRDAFKRRAAFSKVEKSLTRKDWQAILDKHNNTCFYCGVTGVTLTVDHKIPVSKGGPHVKSNVVPACKSCNSRKHSKLLPSIN